MAQAEELMESKCNVWSRIAYLLDALGLIKLTGAAVLFVLFDGSPLFALGIVFAAPVIAACGALTVRLLRQAATGRRFDNSSWNPRQRWRTEFFGTREQPRPRSFADTYADVTPIKYRAVRS